MTDRGFDAMLEQLRIAVHEGSQRLGIRVES
jgi:hypothetical protein